MALAVLDRTVSVVHALTAMGGIPWTLLLVLPWFTAIMRAVGR